jgi:hypothetical protein
LYRLAGRGRRRGGRRKIGRKREGEGSKKMIYGTQTNYLWNYG